MRRVIPGKVGHRPGTRGPGDTVLGRDLWEGLGSPNLGYALKEELHSFSGQPLVEQGLFLLTMARLLWAFDIRPALDVNVRRSVPSSS